VTIALLVLLNPNGDFRLSLLQFARFLVVLVLRNPPVTCL
jgi:hypothetical protein